MGTTVKLLFYRGTYNSFIYLTKTKILLGIQVFTACPFQVNIVYYYTDRMFYLYYKGLPLCTERSLFTVEFFFLATEKVMIFLACQ